MAEPRIVVVGAGPAGVRAAATLAAAGLTPTVLDEGATPGGRIYQQPPPGAGRDAAALYGFEAAKAVAVQAALPSLASRIDYRPGALVWNVHAGALHGTGRDGEFELGFDRLVLATGATDLALPFPGWTLPGVFTLGAAQIALKTQGVAIGRRVALLGAGPLLPLVAYQYAKAGAKPVAVLDATPFAAKLRGAPMMAWAPATLAKGAWYVARLRRAGVALLHGVEAPRAEGEGRVERLRFRVGGVERAVECDAVGASFGLRSETQLADLAGCRFGWDARHRQWIPERDPAGRSSVANVYLAGDGAGIGGADAAESAGERAALAVLEDLGRAFDVNRARFLEARLARLDRFRCGLQTAYPFPQHVVDAIDDGEILCRCEGITAGTLRDAATRLGARELNRAKALTRIGMGRCQGRMCASAAAHLLAAARGIAVADAGRLRAQPPIKPIPVRA